jgi:hypothetical protein
MMKPVAACKPLPKRKKNGIDMEARTDATTSWSPGMSP